MESFSDHVARLQRKRGLTQSQLIRAASGYDKPGTSLDTVRNAVAPGRRPGLPSQVVIEAIARALGVSPDEFAAYRISRARELLDIGIVGLETATAYADALLSLPSVRPADVGEEAARRREATQPAAVPTPPPRSQRGRGT